MYYRIILVLLLCIACSEKKQDMSWEDLKKKSEKAQVILFLGDSLTAGYQLAKENAFPYLIGQKLSRDGKKYITRNAGVSGATSDDVVENLTWYLRDDVRTVFLCIGANDGLRGKSVTKTQQNIATIVEAFRNKDIQVILAGIMLPINYGEEYRTKFYQAYKDTSEKYKLPFMPFLLKDVAGVLELNLADGVHPNKEGHKIIAENIYTFMKENNLLP